MSKPPTITARISLTELEAKHDRGGTFTAPEWRQFDQLVTRRLAVIQRAALNRRVDLKTGHLTAFEERLPLTMKRILEYSTCQSVSKEGEVVRNPEETHSHECRREMTTKELVDYACEGCYHEAGHAIVRVYLRVPFVSVTIEFVHGVHAGFTEASPRYTTTYRDFIDLATVAAAARVATDIFEEANPEMTRFDASDGQDKESIDAQGQQIHTKLNLDPERWKAGIVARAEAILRIPYVWEAVEELAWQLSETEGAYAIPARQVRRILRKAKEKAEVHPSPDPR